MGLQPGRVTLEPCTADGRPPERGGRGRRGRGDCVGLCRLAQASTPRARTAGGRGAAGAGLLGAGGAMGWRFLHPRASLEVRQPSQPSRSQQQARRSSEDCLRGFNKRMISPPPHGQNPGVGDGPLDVKGPVVSGTRGQWCPEGHYDQGGDLGHLPRKGLEKTSLTSSCSLWPWKSSRCPHRQVD